MFDKIIKAKSKAVLQFFTSIWKIDACCWKIQRFDKKEKSFKYAKKEYKVKLVEN